MNRDLNALRGPRILAVLALAALAAGFIATSASAAPIVTMGSVSAASYDSVHATGTVDANDFFSVWGFEYSTDGVNWSPFQSPPGQEVEAGTGPHSVAVDVTGLKGGTTYFLRLAALNNVDTFEGSEAVSAGPNPEFTTLPVDPPAVLKANDAAEVAYTTAKVSGEIERPANPDPAFDSNCRFEYVTDEQFDANGFQGAAQTPCGIDSLTVPNEKKAIATELTGLAPTTEYHLRLTAINAGPDASLSAVDTFTTLAVAAPTVLLDPVTTHTDTTATFTGTIETNAPTPPLSPDAEASFKANWHFECEPACPNFTPEGGAGSVPASAASELVSAQASGLEPNTTYEVKLIASNIGAAGNDHTSFKTTEVGPGVETVPAFALGGGSEALLGGKVNPKNSATKYWFEYGPGPTGPNPTYSASVPTSKDASAGNGAEAVFLTQTLSGLSPGAKYHYRLVAENGGGKVEGEDLGFETEALSPPPVDCPNAQLRAETNSAALPECRAYEMVSPPDKIGGDVNAAPASSPDGNRVAFYSDYGFGDSRSNSVVNSYTAERGSTGWSTHSMQPAIGSSGLATSGAYVPSDFSEDLSRALLMIRSGAAEPTIQNLFLTEPSGTTHWVTAPTLAGEKFDKYYVGRSADASHIVFESQQSFDGQHQGIWEWVDGQVHFVAEGVVGTGANHNNTLTTNFNGTLPEPTAVSADGRRVFFAPGNIEVDVAEEGGPTRQLSLSQRQGSEGQPAQAEFAGAAVDGSRVYFRSPGQLTNDATPGGGLYMYDLETDVLHFVSAGATDPAGAQFQTVTLISTDGKRAYFTAGSQLVPGKGAPGASNLYMADEDGVTFVAVLGPGELASPPQASADGSHFAFSSARRLTAYDNAGHTEVYLYDAGDAGSGGSLRCASCPPDGQVAAGDATPGGEGTLAVTARTHGVSDDGSVFFQSTDALLPADVNGRLDVYEYRDGNLSLLSTGTSNYPSAFWAATADGQDALFTTRDSLVGQDIDGGNDDVYDARVEGGFPAPPVPNPCEGENCQGKAAPSPAFASPATAAGNGKGNAHGRKHKTCKHKSKKQRARCGPGAKKHHAKKASKDGRGK